METGSDGATSAPAEAAEAEDGGGVSSQADTEESDMETELAGACFMLFRLYTPI